MRDDTGPLRLPERAMLMLALVLMIATVLGTLGPVAAGRASTGPDPNYTHCVGRVIGQRADGEFILAAPECYTTMHEATEAAGGDFREGTEVDGAGVLGIIAVHYDLWNYGGNSLSISGSSCTGGYINFRTAYTSWNDRMASTVYGCGSAPITHWENAPASGGACSGAKYVAWTHVPNLGSLSWETSCVKYGP